MFISNAYDKSKELEGVWEDFMGASFKVASSQSSEYKKELLRLSKKQNASQKGKKEDIDIEKNVDLICEAMANTLLLDWKGVGRIDEETGEIVETPYSKENAKQALKDHYELREWVDAFASENENFKREYVEKVSKK